MTLFSIEIFFSSVIARLIAARSIHLTETSVFRAIYAMNAQWRISVPLSSVSCVYNYMLLDLMERKRSICLSINIARDPIHRSISIDLFFLVFESPISSLDEQILLARDQIAIESNHPSQWVTASVDFFLSFCPWRVDIKRRFSSPIDLISCRWSLFHIRQDTRNGRTRCICNWWLNHPRWGQRPEENREKRARMRS